MKYILIFIISIMSLFAEASIEQKTKNSESFYLKGDIFKPTKCDYGKCPTVKGEYRTRIKSIDYQNGTIYCYVYEKDTDKVLGTVHQNNEKCKTKRNNEKIQFENKLFELQKIQEQNEEDTKTKKGFLDIKEQKDFYFGSYISTGNQEFLNASKYMIAGLTLDDKIININESINKNRVILRDEYTMYPNASTNYHDDSLFSSILSFFSEVKEKEGSELVKDDSTRLVSQASSLLSGITVFIMHFMGGYNEQMLGIKAFLFFTIIPFTGFFILQSKLTKKLSDTQDYDDIFERVFFTALTLFVFYFSTTHIKIDNLNFREQTQISQSNFQNWFRNIFYEGADFATEIARVGTTSYLKYKIQDIGVASKEVLRNQKLEKKILEREQSYYIQKNGFLDYCYKTFKVDKLKEDLRIYSTFNTTFPHKETMTIYDEVLGERTVNWYASNTYINQGYEDSPLSVSGCYNIERAYLNNKAKIEDLSKDIEIYIKVNKDVTINKQIEILTKTQYRNSAELGWIGFTMIPTLNIAINELQIIDKSTRNEIDKSKLEQIREDTENTNKVDKVQGAESAEWVSEIISGIAYMSLPGADSIYNVFNNGGKTVVTEVAKKIPFLAGIVANFLGQLAVSALALVLTIYIMKFLIVIFPLIGIIMAGSMAIAYYFISIELYYIVSPFLIAFAMASQQGDIIKKFLKVGVSLALRPIMIVISLVMAIWVYEFFNIFNLVLVDWNFSSIFAIKDTGGIQPFNTLFLTIAKEFIHIGINIVAFFVVFYMVLNGASMILDMLGLSDANVDVQSVVGSNIDNKSSKWNSGGI